MQTGVYWVVDDDDDADDMRTKKGTVKYHHSFCNFSWKSYVCVTCSTYMGMGMRHWQNPDINILKLATLMTITAYIEGITSFVSFLAHIFIIS